MLTNVRPTAAEKAMTLPGDEIISQPDVVMDRAFTLSATPEQVWPWFMQLGKNRAGWYFPRWINWLFVKGSRGLWRIDPKLHDLHVGQIIDDWGGKDGYFEVAQLEPPRVLVHKSTRGKLSMSWAITLWALEKDQTRVIIRLRLSGMKHSWMAERAGGFIDWLTIAALAAGLRQRLTIS